MSPEVLSFLAGLVVGGFATAWVLVLVVLIRATAAGRGGQQ